MEPTSQLSLAEMSCNVLVWHLMDSGSEKIGLLFLRPRPSTTSGGLLAMLLNTIFMGW
jgi:hypothetical protein